MAQFTYTAVNKSGKKLSGLISATSEDEARKQLNLLGVSILDIKESAKQAPTTKTIDSGTSEVLEKFEFEAFDKAGKKVIGTIPASSRFKAFKRLVEEYNFEVAFVVKDGASQEEKEKGKKEDLSILKAEYEANTHSKGTAEDAILTPEFEIKRKALLKKVDFILEKIKQILATYSDEIKPENKKIIQDYVDKLLRIKSSTNLNYIEHISEELLKKVQDQELFLHKEKMDKTRSELKFESQKMLSQLHSGQTNSKDITDDIATIKNKLGKSNIKLLQAIGSYISHFLPSPEVKELKSTIKSVNKQIWTFGRIWLTSPKVTKKQAYDSLMQIVNEKKRLVATLKEVKQKERKTTMQKTTPDSTEKIENEPLIIEEINQFLGWMLGFYLMAYFFSHYLITKTFSNGNPLPGNFNLLFSPILRYVLVSIFLWFILLSIRLRYMHYKSWSNGLVIAIGILINATLIFNL